MTYRYPVTRLTDDCQYASIKAAAKNVTRAQQSAAAARRRRERYLWALAGIVALVALVWAWVR